jgi:hypothetical protein
LPVRSKKVSEFGDAVLQLGQMLDEVGHAGGSVAVVEMPES